MRHPQHFERTTALIDWSDVWLKDSRCLFGSPPVLPPLQIEQRPLDAHIDQSGAVLLFLEAKLSMSSLAQPQRIVAIGVN